MERSQSCSDTGQDRAKSRLRAAPTSKAKVDLRHSFFLGSLVPSHNLLHTATKEPFQMRRGTMDPRQTHYVGEFYKTDVKGREFELVGR